MENFEIKTYKGDPWFADESEECVRIFKGNFQICKIPKDMQEMEAYYPEPKTIEWMLAVLNEAEKKSPSSEK
jgi:hypothetical protein